MPFGTNMNSLYNLSLDGNRGRIIEYIAQQKQKAVFKVIDVGASQNAWSASVVDTIVDFNSPNVDNKIKQLNFDITDYEAWKVVEDEVEQNGKYDFSICSHTLEDIIDPRMVVKKLAKISKAGFIAIPSKYTEFTRNIETYEISLSPYRGYIHHRWVFSVKNNIFTAYPKVNFLEYCEIGDIISNNDKERKYIDLNFFWKDNIELHYVNNNYLGPTISSVVSYYNDLIFDDCDKYIQIYEQQYH